MLGVSPLATSSACNVKEAMLFLCRPAGEAPEQRTADSKSAMESKSHDDPRSIPERSALLASPCITSTLRSWMILDPQIMLVCCMCLGMGEYNRIEVKHEA